MKIKILISLLIVIISTNLMAENYNFKNDYLYRKILLKYNIFAENWCVESKEKFPAQLLRYQVANETIGTDGINKLNEGILAPLEVLVFEKDSSFIFYWYKNEYEVGEITGNWDIDNSNLILTLSQDYVKPYLKGIQLRYKITGTDNSKSELYLNGEKKSLGILETSDDILSDFTSIVSAIDQKYVSKKFPEIIQEKEKQLMESLRKRKN